jgi:hypothetical protein
VTCEFEVSCRSSPWSASVEEASVTLTMSSTFGAARVSPSGSSRFGSEESIAVGADADGAAVGSSSARVAPAGAITRTSVSAASALAREP